MGDSDPFEVTDDRPKRVVREERGGAWKNGTHGSGPQKKKDNKPAVTKGCDPWRFGVPIVHSLRDQTPPLCDCWREELIRALTTS